MIIKRGYFFYVSTLPDLDKKIIKPGIPDNFLVRGKFVDNKIRRIRLYKTIEEAISGLYLGENFRKGTKMYVYRALGINKDYLLGPMNIVKVPYAMLIKEFWYTSSLRLEKIGEVKLEKKGEEIFKYGPRQTQAKLYRWSWYEERRYILEEKDYSIISDLHHSGIKRTYQKSIGRIRRKLGDQISKSIQKDVITNRKLENNLRKTQSSANPVSEKTKKELDKRIGESGTYISESKSARQPSMSYSKSYKTNVIEIPADQTVDYGDLTHEFGHVLNQIENPKRTSRAIEANKSLSRRTESIMTAKRGENLNLTSEGTSIGEDIINYHRAKREEASATRKGLRTLKKLGATKEEIGSAKTRLDGFGKTYDSYKLPYKHRLRDAIQIKSPGKTTNFRDDLDRIRKDRRRKIK